MQWYIFGALLGKDYFKDVPKDSSKIKKEVKNT